MTYPTIPAADAHEEMLTEIGVRCAACGGDNVLDDECSMLCPAQRERDLDLVICATFGHDFEEHADAGASSLWCNRCGYDDVVFW